MVPCVFTLKRNAPFIPIDESPRLSGAEPGKMFLFRAATNYILIKSQPANALRAILAQAECKVWASLSRLER